MNLAFDHRHTKLHVREEHHVDPHAGDGARLLYASDLHLRRRDETRAIEIATTAAATRPDAILLGGDLVDSPRAHELLCALVRDLGTVAPVLAVSGNHDVFWGEHAVKKAVERGGGHFITDRRIRIATRGGAIDVGGDVSVFDPDPSAATRVLCGHDPAVFDRACDASVDLVLAGHLHGGQVVLGQRGERLYPGAFVYPYCGLRFDRGATTMFVSRGVADTVPIRFRCPREVIVCTVRHAT